jgi:hypothetical protein
MADVGARSHWRDAVLLLVLAIVIAGGLVHYGRDMTDEPSASTGHSLSGKPSTRAQAELDSARPADPATPSGGTCWDGRHTASLSLCGLPDGARGLAWVFPSFADSRASCYKAEPSSDSYPVVESYECFQQALGQPVTVTYDQVEDPEQVEHWLLARLGKEHMREVPGPHGGRCVFKDGTNRPARITGMYEQFPYVVSVYADSPQAASRAWKVLVRQRPPQAVRGVRA